MNYKKDYKKWKLLTNRLIELLNLDEMYISSENKEWWTHWKSRNLKEPEFEVFNLKERKKQNTLAIQNTIEELLDLDNNVYEQAELIFK